MKKQLSIALVLLLSLLSLGMYIGSISGAVDNSIDDGRLSASSTDPAPATDQTAITTIYWTPNNKGNRIALLDTSSSPNAWTLINSPSVSLSVPATTSQMYDVFGYLSSGAMVLSATAWTNDTTRATALTTQDGVYAKTGATNYRYLGSFRTTTVSGQTEDSVLRRFIYNQYNQIPRQLKMQDTTASWTSTSTTYAYFNANSADKVEFVLGDTGLPQITCYGYWSNTVTSGTIAIGLDGIAAGNVAIDGGQPGSGGVTLGTNWGTSCETHRPITAGYHYAAAIDKASSATTVTFIGSGQSGFSSQITGLIGTTNQ